MAFLKRNKHSKPILLTQSANFRTSRQQSLSGFARITLIACRRLDMAELI